jgi:hypothetical protein
MDGYRGPPGAKDKTAQLPVPREGKKEKRDSSHPQADAFAGAKEEEKIGLLRSE